MWFTAESVLDILRTDNVALLPKETKDSLLSTLILAFIGLHENGKAVFFAQGVLQVFKNRLRPDEMLLVGRYIADEDQVTGEARRQELVAHHNQCMLPMNLSSPGVEPHQTMQSLVRGHSEPSFDPEDAASLSDSSNR